MAPLHLPRREPLYDVHPLTGISIEVFWADTTLETFGRGGAGWFWWSSSARVLTGWSGDRSVCYELRSVSARDERCTNAWRTKHSIPCAKNVTRNSRHAMPLRWKA